MKSLFKVLILGAALITTGCEPTAVGKAKQDYLCRDMGGVGGYTTNNITSLTCNNGKTFGYSVVRDVIIEDPTFYAKSK